MEFSEQIKVLRKENGLTQGELAEKLDVTRQAVSNWENNKNFPDIKTIIRIAKVFDVSLDELILGEKHLEEKLVKDGSEGRRARMNLISIAIGAGLMIMGLMCLIIKANSVEYIDGQGVLHENFYLLPIGFVFMFTGLLVILVTLLIFGVKNWKERHFSHL